MGVGSHFNLREEWARRACSLVVSVAALAGAARAQFGPEQVIDTAPGEIRDVHAADLDGDGDLDLLVCRTSGTMLAWYPNLGGGAFGPAQPFAVQPLGAVEAVTVDVGGDGDLDVLAVVIAIFTPFGNYYRVDLFENQGGGTFGPPTTIVPQNSSDWHLGVGDFEGDGDLDLFVVHGVTVTVSLLQAGQLGAPFDITQTAFGLHDFRVSDVDGDGDADVVDASLGLGQILWYENLGSAGPFGGPHVIDGTFPAPFDVDAADLDNDGRVDVVGVGWLTPGSGTGDMHWIEQAGAGAWGAPHPITITGYPERVLCRSIDGDGYRDVFVGLQQGAEWFANDGFGNFGAAQPVDQGTDTTRAMVAADLDGGGIDLVLGTATAGGGGRIIWHRNLNQTAATFCSGDGSGTPCPCGNSGVAGNGCASSVDAGGARLSANGVPSVASDSFVLVGTHMPNSSALYFQGTMQVLGGNGVVFGDGLRCAGGTITRLGAKMNVAGTSAYPTGGDVHISIKGGDVPGNVRQYQCWYRNAAPFCTASTFNLTNGLETTWVP
jgi:hypothetical protein